MSKKNSATAKAARRAEREFSKPVVEMTHRRSHLWPNYDEDGRLSFRPYKQAPIERLNNTRGLGGALLRCSICTFQREYSPGLVSEHDCITDQTDEEFTRSVELQWVYWLRELVDSGANLFGFVS